MKEEFVVENRARENDAQEYTTNTNTISLNYTRIMANKRIADVIQFSS